MAADITGRYIGLDADTLSTMRTNALAAYNACLTGHQAYGRPGFSFNRVQFEALAADLAEINYAIAAASGDRPNRTYADLSA